MKIINIVSVVFAGVLASTSSLAALIDSGSTVIDSDTNLEWSKLLPTTSTSYNQMALAFTDPGSTFFGYQHATRSDLETLFANGGYVGDYFSNIVNATQPATYAAINDIYTLFGPPGVRAFGFFDDETTNNSNVGRAVVIPDLTPTLSLIRIQGDVLPPTTINSGPNNPQLVGNWIFKAAPPVASIPEAPFVVLFVTLLFLIRRSFAK